jgi:hypothetical protein
VPLLNITHNVRTAAHHGLSTSRKLGIAFGSIIAVGFFTGLLIFFYLILYHRLRARAHTRSWKRHVNPRKLYMDRGRASHHRKRDDSDDNNVSNTEGPCQRTVTMVGLEEDSLNAGGGGGEEDSLTDPFAVFAAVDFTPVSPLEEMSKSTSTAAARSPGARPRRENGNGWRNFEDYAYL